MALDTYANLQTTIGNFLNRADLTSAIPDFITLAEAEMRRRLRTRRATGRSDATLTSEYIAVPSDFGGPIAITLTGTSPIALLEYAEPSKMLEAQQGNFTGTGQPRWYSVVGENLQFMPAPDGSYTIEMTYWKGLTALSASSTTNWMLTDNPDAYLYGALIHSAPYLVDDERISTWAGIFSAIMDDIKVSDAQSAYGGRLNQKAKAFG